MAIAASILFQVNSTNYTNATPFTIYQPTAGNSGFVTTLKLTVNLNSIAEASFPYIPDDTPPDTLQQILDEIAINTEFRELILFFRKGTGAWIERARLRIFNKEPYYDIPLVRLFSDSNTIDVAEDFSLGIQVKAGDILTAADTILVWGSAVEEKKNDPGLEALSDRISALESLLSVFGAPTSTLAGTNGLVPAPPAGGGSRLLRDDRTWQDPAAFISSSNSGIYGSAEVPNIAKGGWNGIFLAGGGNKNYLMMNPATGDIGLYNSAVPRWNIYFNDTSALIGLPLSINGLPAIKKIQFLSTIISLPNIAAGGLHQVDIALSGAAVGQYTHASPIINSVLNGLWTFYWHTQILSTNTISIVFKNDWTGALDLPDFWVRIMYIEL